MKKFTFLIPVYNDWESFNILIEKIELQISELDYEFSIIVLNDFSSLKHNIVLKNLKKIKNCKIIQLNSNVGSQRAIAIGLRHISQINMDEQNIIIMDSDGQDDPEILNKIIDMSTKYPDDIITINRTRRSEALWFKILYELHYYTLILLSGHKIRYGNYGLINTNKIEKLLLTGDLWSAYPAAISKSFKKTNKIFHERKERYSGNTRMNLYKLFNHSVRVFSVFKYKIFIISLIYSAFFLFLGSSFYYFIFPLLLANFLTFISSYKNKEKFDKCYESIIDKVEMIK